MRPEAWLHRRRMTRRSFVDRLLDKWNLVYAAWLSFGIVAATLGIYGPLLGLARGPATLCLAVGAGFGIGLGLVELVRLRHRVLEARLIGRLPKMVDVLHGDDEKQVIAVTRRNGESVIVNLPPEYHPEEDGGEAVMRQVVPELFKKMEDDGYPS